MKNKEILETLREILEEEDVSLNNFACSEVEETFNDIIRSKLGEFVLVQGAKRTEGYGDYDGAQSVFYFKDHNVYISVEGSYLSEYGMDFDDIHIVVPEKITSTVYYIVEVS